jgi:hypothetical protein
MHTCLMGMREPRYVEISSAILNDAASRVDLAELHEARTVSVPTLAVLARLHRARRRDT